MKYLNHFLVLTAALSYSSLSIIYVLLNQQKIDAFNLVFYRFFFPIAITLIIAFFFFRKTLKLKRKEFYYLLVNAALLTLGIISYALSVYMGTPIAKAIILTYSYPLTIVLVSYILLREFPRPKQLLAITLSFISVLILFEFWKIKSLWEIRTGDLLAILNSLVYGSDIVWVTKMRRDTNINPITAVIYNFIIGTFLLFFVAFLLTFFGLRVFIPAVKTNFSILVWILLVVLGLTGTVIPQLSVYFASKKLKPHVTSVLLLTEPVWVIIFGWLIFGQSLSIWGIIGAIGIIFSVLLV